MPEVIDLTGDESPPRIEARKRSAQDFDNDNEDDVQIVSVGPALPSPARRGSRKTVRNYKPRRRASGNSSSNPDASTVRAKEKKARDNGFEIVESRPLTAEEKFRRIQDLHRRNITVPEPANPGGYVPGYIHNALLNEQFQMLHRQFFAQHPQLLQLLRMPRETQSLEDRIFAQTLEHSVEDTHRRREDLHTSMLTLPPDPPVPAPGFGHQLGETGKASVCTRCGSELGITKEGLADSGRVFVRGCGHGYCGVCTKSMPALPRAQAQCPVPRCRALRSRRKNQFREIFI